MPRSAHATAVLAAAAPSAPWQPAAWPRAQASITARSYARSPIPIGEEPKESGQRRLDLALAVVNDAEGLRRAAITDLVEAWRPKAEGAAAEVLRLVDQVSGARKTKVVGWPPPAPNGTGPRLVDFLKAEASRAALDLIVTGHSKGGALAPALALWLAETRKRWDPKGVARIGCYTFAGPTPGDGAFGRRVVEKLDGRCRRVSNTDDLVTHAWDDSSLSSIEQLYGGAFRWLAPVVTALRARLREDDYEPVSLPPEEFEGTHLPNLSHDLDPVGQFVQQHMDAYLEYTGLRAKRVDTLKLFLW